MGGYLQEIMPLHGSILQDGTCQILSLAENPRWSQVRQYFKSFCRHSGHVSIDILNQNSSIYPQCSAYAYNADTGEGGKYVFALMKTSANCVRVSACPVGWRRRLID